MIVGTLGISEVLIWEVHPVKHRRMMSSEAEFRHLGCYCIRIRDVSEPDRVPTHSTVCTGSILLLTGLCPLANGGLCGSRASTGDGLRLVSARRLDASDIRRSGTHRFECCRLSISMQSIQNLGLALIAMVAGTILDTRGYLILEVFFCICVCSEFSCVCFVLLLLGLDHNRFSVSVALMAVVALYFVDYLRGKRGTPHH